MSSVESVYAPVVMALLPEGTVKRVASFVVAMILAGACTSLLGDFESAGSSSSASSSGQAGDTGTVGGMGGSGGSSASGGSGGIGGQAPLLPFDCAWKRSSHLLLESLEGKKGEYWGSSPMAVSMAGGAVRVFVPRQGPNGDVIEVRSILNDATSAAMFPADRLQDAERLDDKSIAVLFSRLNSNGIVSLFMRVYEDASFDGTEYVEHQLVSDSAFKDADLQNPSVRALLTVRQDPEGGWAVDVLLSYKTMTGDYLERFVRYDGKTPQTGTVITQPSVSLDYGAAYLRGFERFEGKSYGFFGQGVMRFYIIEDNVSGPLTARVLSDSGDDLWMGTLATPKGLNISMALSLQSPPISLRLGQLKTAELVTFEPETLTLAETWATTDDIPVNAAALKWLGNLYVFLGESQSKAAQMVYAYYDAFGNKRGTGDLPFTGMLPGLYERIDIEAVDVVTEAPAFDTLGGLAHVVWREEQGDGVDATFDVMYHDQLECSPIDPGENE